MKFALKAAVLAAMVALVPATALAEGDAKKGEKVFNKCKACHKVGDKARNGVGPVLNGIVGRKAGTGEKYKYSKLNHNAGEAGLVWTEENLMAYLPDPSAFLKKFLEENGKKDEAKGRSKMTYKLKKEQDRADVIAYLKTFTK